MRLLKLFMSMGIFCNAIPSIFYILGVINSGGSGTGEGMGAAMMLYVFAFLLPHIVLFVISHGLVALRSFDISDEPKSDDGRMFRKIYACSFVLLLPILLLVV